jgi:hypothetical protein
MKAFGGNPKYWCNASNGDIVVVVVVLVVVVVVVIGAIVVIDSVNGCGCSVIVSISSLLT